MKLFVKALPGAVLLFAVAPGTVSAADCASVGFFGPTPESVQGVTFAGTVRSVELDEPESEWETYIFEVDRVWAGPVRPRSEVVNYSCGTVRFDIGERYLFSWSGPDGIDYGPPPGVPTDETSVAWRIDADGTLDLVSFGPRLKDYPEAFQVTDLHAAIAVVAPGTSLQVPAPPDSSTSEATRTERHWLLLVVAMGGLLGLRLKRRGTGL